MDKFYTNSDIAKKYIDITNKICDFNNFDIILEPSAGNGSFYLLLPENKREGIDIEPNNKEIKKMNFYEYKFNNNKKYMVIGNPPFGKISSDAVKFFNKSAEFANIIAFIFPRTFKRVSIQNRLNLNFHLIFNEDLPMKPCCFSPKMDAKCCFQIWKKENKKRDIVKYEKNHKDFEFVKFTNNNGKLKYPINSDFAMKAYGSNCGEIIETNLFNLSPKSYH